MLDTSEDGSSHGPYRSLEFHRSGGDYLFKRKVFRRAIEFYDSAVLQIAEVLYSSAEFEKALLLFNRGYNLRPEISKFRIGIQKCEYAIRNSLEVKKPIRLEDLRIEDQLNNEYEPYLSTVSQRIVAFYREPQHEMSFSWLAPFRYLMIKECCSFRDRFIDPFWPDYEVFVQSDKMEFAGYIDQIFHGIIVAKFYFINQQFRDNFKRDTVTSAKTGTTCLTQGLNPNVVHQADSADELSAHNSKLLLGALESDRMYLKSLAKQTSELENQTKYGKHKSKQSSVVQQIARDGVAYLNGRRDFWYLENPGMLGIKRKKFSTPVVKKVQTKQPTLDQEKLLKELRKIERHQLAGKYLTAMKLGEKLLWCIEADFKPDNVMEEHNAIEEILANLHSMLGLSYLESNKLDRAMKVLQIARDLGGQCGLPDVVSHAEDNIGRVYAKRGDYHSAIQVWERKLQTHPEPLDCIWLHYEIGRCYLESDKISDALNCAEMALKEANKLGNDQWLLDVNILLGQVNMKMCQNANAKNAFTKALGFAKKLNISEAEEAILEAMGCIETTEEELSSETLSSETSSDTMSSGVGDSSSTKFMLGGEHIDF